MQKKTEHIIFIWACILTSIFSLLPDAHAVCDAKKWIAPCSDQCGMSMRIQMGKSRKWCHCHWSDCLSNSGGNRDIHDAKQQSFGGTSLYLIDIVRSSLTRCWYALFAFLFFKILWTHQRCFLFMNYVFLFAYYIIGIACKETGQETCLRQKDWKSHDMPHACRMPHATFSSLLLNRGEDSCWVQTGTHWQVSSTKSIYYRPTICSLLF